MLYREIIAVRSQIHTKHIITLCGQKVKFLKVKLSGTYSYRCGSYNCGAMCSIQYGACDCA